jgi:hypothetical protein
LFSSIFVITFFAVSLHEERRAQKHHGNLKKIPAGLRSVQPARHLALAPMLVAPALLSVPCSWLL